MTIAVSTAFGIWNTRASRICVGMGMEVRLIHEAQNIVMIEFNVLMIGDNHS